MLPNNAGSSQSGGPFSQYPIHPLLQPSGPDTPYPSQAPPQNGRVPPSTRLAHIYGVGGPPHFENAGRSGFTPTALPEQAAYPLSAESIKRFDALNRFQRGHLQYTTLELDNLGAIYKPDAKPNNLTNAIHPIFEKHHWQQQGTVPVDIPGINGFYDVNNPPVWEALLPCLRLSTMILSNINLWAWWDALIYGERRLMPVPPRNPFYPHPCETFHLRPVEEMMASARTGAVKRFINKLSDTGHYFEIETGDMRMPNPTTGFVPSRNVQGANILLDADQRLSKTTLSWQVLEPLLRTGLGALGPSQRLAQQFQIAKTMVHELCHQIGRNTEHACTAFEPHFEDESVAELGRSMEKAIFGFCAYGVGPPFRQSQTRPIIANLFSTWPSHFDHTKSDRRGATLNPPELVPGFQTEWWAMPISYFESLQQAEFWTHIVTRFGHTAIQPYPKIHGMTCQFVAEDAREIYSEMVGPDYDTWRSLFQGIRDMELEAWQEHVGNGTARERLWKRERIRDARYRAALFDRSNFLASHWYHARRQMRAVDTAANHPPQPPGQLDHANIDPALFHE